MKIIIEHLDPRLWKWSLLEYKHISEFASKDNLIFTNIKGPKTAEKLSKLGTVYKESVKELNFKNACILDPDAKETLTPKDKFDYVIMGGIHLRKGQKRRSLARWTFLQGILGKGRCRQTPRDMSHGR